MTALNPKEEHDAVVRALCKENEAKFKVLNNLDEEKHYVAGRFPDIIFQDKEGKLMFILEVRKNGTIAECIQQWKSVKPLPAFLYVVVPESDLQNAKSIARVIGLNVKFASYTLDAQNKVTIKYE